MFLILTGAALLYQAANTARMLSQSLWFTGGLLAATAGSVVACGFSMFGLLFIGALVWMLYLMRPTPAPNANVQGLVFTYGAAAFVLVNLLVAAGKTSAAFLVLPVILLGYFIGKFVIREYE